MQDDHRSMLITKNGLGTTRNFMEHISMPSPHNLLQDMGDLFLDAKSSAIMLKENDDKYMH